MLKRRRFQSPRTEISVRWKRRSLHPKVGELVGMDQCQHFPFILGERICGIAILKITQFRPIHIFTLGNCRLFRFLQTLFALFLKFIRPLVTVLDARLLKLLIAFLLFVIRLNLYTRMQVRIIMSLPPTELIIYLHLKRVHFQMLLCKAADQLGPLGVSISLIIWLGDQRWKKVC